MGQVKKWDQLQENCFSREELEIIRRSIKIKYRKVAVSADGYFKYITGKSGAMFLGYAKESFDTKASEYLNSFCGVGDPFSIAEIGKEEVVLDIGCGAGFDVSIASKLVGPEGKVFGVDLCEEMVTRAQKYCSELGLANIEFQTVADEKLPFDSNHFDVVISNGVFNLSPRKGKLFKEIYRILKPGGRIQFADIVLDRELPDRLAGSHEAWSQ